MFSFLVGPNEAEGHPAREDVGFACMGFHSPDDRADNAADAAREDCDEYRDAEDQAVASDAQQDSDDCHYEPDHTSQAVVQHVGCVVSDEQVIRVGAAEDQPRHPEEREQEGKAEQAECGHDDGCQIGPHGR